MQSENVDGLPAEVATEDGVIDSNLFRTVLGHFCSGITVITANCDGVPAGLTCQSFFSLSLDPALVAFSVSKTSTSYPQISAARSLVINILASDQAEISNAFSKSGTDKWAGIEWRGGRVHGHPVIRGAVAYLECDIESEVDAGDHILVVARVRHLEAGTADGEAVSPLLFYRGGYVRLEGDRELETEGAGR